MGKLVLLCIHFFLKLVCFLVTKKKPMQHGRGKSPEKNSPYLSMPHGNIIWLLGTDNRDLKYFICWISYKATEQSNLHLFDNIALCLPLYN